MADLNRLSVIYYHSVGPFRKEWENNFLTTGADIFEEHLVWLSRRYTTISLPEYRQIRKGLTPPVKNPLVITFDDGYLDNWVWAFPLLRKYGMKATIFVSPEFVDERSGCRPNSENYRQGEDGSSELNGWGFLSWDEMRMMESTGLIDIQSHALTHSRYFISDKLTGFHHPGGRILDPVINAYSEIKPYYIGKVDLESMLPYGFPLFEDRPALIARKVEINPDFIDECVNLFRNYDFTSYDQDEAFNLAMPLYSSYLKENRLIVRSESDREYDDRVTREIVLSRKIIGEKLDKEVSILCWPHGGNNDYLHRKALEAGYLMTTTGKARDIKRNDMTRIPDRAVVDLSTRQKRLRTILKMRAFSGQEPYYTVLNISRRLRRI
ncbi:MAG: polysaccharide deacetylase family protein [Bacteroidales bacterium]|nr:polysaccharide deacetylase family protein [Bacteroidales bacterium]MDT8374974.1 polysaccharide deacetylase family protein [Bacteroidales bacterium]